MACGAGEPSSKRAKADEADEEEDPLVRRKEEVVRLLEEARAKGKGTARAKEELLTLCADFEAKNEKLLERLLPELWEKIVDEYLHQNDLLALAMACGFFRDTTKDLGKKVVTDLYYGSLLRLQKSGRVTSHTLGWFQWVCDTWEILPGYEARWLKRVKGAVYEGNLVNYAAVQGSVEILSWLEEKGWELNEDTGKWAGLGGAVEVLEYLVDWGYEFEFIEGACAWAARGGRLEALKFLRGLDPPCRWDETTCAWAAEYGRLDVLKWLRAQDPPCPWDGTTCFMAARYGYLEVLKWARSQDPPCPWDELTCSWAAQGGHLEVLQWAGEQDPPCPCDQDVCYFAAREGHLDVLEWARDQDPPCPWSWKTCAWAAVDGRLDVLKWVRDQDPPCPWSRGECREEASHNGHDHIVDWIDQQEDESDEEKYRDWGSMEFSYSENEY